MRRVACARFSAPRRTQKGIGFAGQNLWSHRRDHPNRIPAGFEIQALNLMSFDNGFHLYRILAACA
jgi:hypothetical protein